MISSAATVSSSTGSPAKFARLAANSALQRRRTTPCSPYLSSTAWAHKNKNPPVRQPAGSGSTAKCRRLLFFLDAFSRRSRAGVLLCTLVHVLARRGSGAGLRHAGAGSGPSLHGG